MKEKCYYGELVLGVVVKSQLEFENFLNMFEENGLRANLSLVTLDKKETDAEVLDVYSAEWSELEE